MKVTIVAYMRIAQQITDVRDKIVSNITYANQISGEDDDQYREELRRIDQSYNRILDKIDQLEVVDI